MKGNNSSVSDFFSGMSECTPATDERETTIAYRDLTGMMAEVLIVLDFQHRNFRYVSNHALLLCGYSPEQVKALGYDFFREALHPKALPIWIDMHHTMLQRLYQGPSSAHSINYFACTFRIKSFLPTFKQSDYLMVYLKLKPKWIDGQPRFGICLLSHAVVPKAGNLCVYYDNHDHETYALKTKRWTYHRFAPLSQRQKEMLVWAKQGLTQKAMADKMNVSIKTIESMRTVLFQQFGVSSIEQAIQYATNRRLLYHIPFDEPGTGGKKQAKRIYPPLIGYISTFYETFRKGWIKGKRSMLLPKRKAYRRVPFAKQLSRAN